MIWILLLTAISLAFLSRYGVQQLVGQWISYAFNTFLVWGYPIRSIDTGKTIPGPSYVWPNGQGDTEKFLNGEQASKTWYAKYGPVYRIWSGMSSEIVLTRPEHIRAVFRDSDQHIKAPNNDTGYLMELLLGRCVGLISGSAWRNLRAHAETPFLRTSMDAHVGLITRRIQAHVDHLWHTTDRAITTTTTTASSSSSRAFDPVADLKLLPFLIVAEVLYGPLPPALEAQLCGLVDAREAVFRTVIRGGLARFRLARFLPLAATGALRAFQRRWAAFNRAARAHARAAAQAEAGAPIVQMYEAVDAGRIAEEELLQTLDEMLYANLDVTMGGVSWCLVFLARHPEAWGTLRGEIREQREKAAGGERAFERYLLSGGSYLDACVLEASRLRPLAAFSVPQAAPTDRVVEGYRIPAGTQFVVDSHALNRRNPFWGGDPLEYRPSRFREHKTTEFRYNYWRFGFGPRQCIGKYVADTILRGLLVYMTETYELEGIANGDEFARDQETWILHPQVQITWKRSDDATVAN